MNSAAGLTDPGGRVYADRDHGSLNASRYDVVLQSTRP